MARGKSRGSRPTHYIAVTAKVGKGKYEKGPYIGLWEGDDDNGPLYRGSSQGKYLDELFDFIKEYGDESVSFAVFESRGGGKSRRNRDEDDEDQPPRGRSSRGRSRDREEDKEDDRDSRSSRGSKRSRSRDDEDEDRGSSRRGSKDKDSGRGGKGSDWWDD